jgi:hypothetical protein
MDKNSHERFEELIGKIRINLNDDKRFADTLQFVRDRMEHYASVLGLNKTDILEAIEGRRSYWAANFYQEANFPKIEEPVVLYETYDEMVADIQPKLGFICSACGGVTTDPNKCNSGKEMSKGKVCNWTTYGLFRSANAYRCVIKESFLEKPIVYEIFMPVSKQSNNDEVSNG